MKKIRSDFTPNPEFNPTKVRTASSAAEGLCRWVLAIEIYDRVAKVVAPKKVCLVEAEESLRVTMSILREKQAELKEVEDRLATLKQQFQEKTREKETLEEQVRCCLVCVCVLSMALLAGRYLCQEAGESAEADWRARGREGPLVASRPLPPGDL